MNTNETESNEIGRITLNLRSEDANVIRALLVAVWALRQQPGFDKASFEGLILTQMHSIPSQETKDILKTMLT